MHTTVDSNWGTDNQHYKSFTGLISCLLGDTILYKTKYQDCIAESSTETKFTAAFNDKRPLSVLFSILDEIGIPQDMTIPLYIDNEGALIVRNAQ